MARYGYFAVYALADPDTKRIFYVGRSKRPQTRFKQHLKEALEAHITDPFAKLFGLDQLVTPDTAFEGNDKKLGQIRQIVARGQEPLFIIIDEWEAETLSEANRLEDAWIAEMRRRGEPLTNMTISRRMETWWYDRRRPGFKPGWAASPMEFIQRLKAGEYAGSPYKTRGKPYRPARKAASKRPYSSKPGRSKRSKASRSGVRRKSPRR